jgi:uncharacterized protein YggU (UPF0235/DUF167 family)
LQIKVIAKSSRNRIVGWMEEVLKVSVTATPTRGEANLAVRHLLATTLGLPKSRIQIVTGATASRKQVQVEGLDDAEIYRRLEHN